jgi:excisionase family DNA binding protein
MAPTEASGAGGGEKEFPEVLTTAMAAELLHVHVEHLRRLVREGVIPSHRFPGGREIRFMRDELLDWLRAQPGEDRSTSTKKARRRAT